MARNAMLKALMQLRRMGKLMEEFQMTSQQLAQSLDRNDAVSVRICLSMRQEALDGMKQAKQYLFRQIEEISDTDVKNRLLALLNGAQPDHTEDERTLADQVAANARLHSRIVELDESISRKLARDRSIYAK